MKRVNEIWNHPVYQTHLTKVLRWEEERKFCRHTVEHFLDTARLAYIYSLEEGLCIPKDLIYAAALLHDIGRHLQYEEGTPHEKASAGIAAQILPECGFTEAECERILDAVLSHRRSAGRSDFGRIFYRADKMSRCCFSCPVQEECDWPEEKKNLQIQY
ncbi:HD domain-containing protein [Ruminococcus gauvreauii]|uniref:HD domain-containing protein n=1 Tax=Ruminococcus gauvreauii TaxID=438033 RepID=A0ABY5VK79_9FIRM|nr:HD domain-containing protein [Ruminococcus gauvreauii]UWP60712.1 HD domain-containing protein [Ruminococcus gauvreauii]